LVSKLGVKNVTIVSSADGPVVVPNIDNSPENAERMLHTTLEDLKTDYLDLYMIHWVDTKVPVQKTMEYLLAAKRDGLIRNIGVCNFNQVQMEEALSVGPVDVAQNDFSFLNQVVQSTGYLDFLREKGIGFMSFGTLARGLLSGKFTEDKTYDKSDWRYHQKEIYRCEFVRHHGKIKEMSQEAKKARLTLPQMAVKWVLEQPGIGLALCGSRTPAQIQELCAVLKTKK
jgi:aryl-alcohol dehydrogenase-like predicted oxidoreductase